MAKITRKLLKVFGLSGDATNFAKFGSQVAGAPVKSKDIELIQSLAAWNNGLQDAVVAANKAPYLEDINALLHVLAYQSAYQLQEGIPEWNTDTIYYVGSIVKKTGTTELYASLTNDNSGNALGTQADTTYWKYIGPLTLLLQAYAKFHAITGHGHTGATDDAPLITAAGLATNAVTTAKILDANVTPIKMARNIVQVKLSDDFFTTSVTFVTRTGAVLNITTRANAKVILHFRIAGVSITNSTLMRITRDSGAEYVTIGAAAGGNGYLVFGGSCYFSALSAGSHEFKIDVEVGSGGRFQNYITSDPTGNCCEMIAEEI